MGNSENLLTIMQMITQADQLASQKDADSYIALFSDDGKIEGTQGSATGQEELKSMVQNVWKNEGHTLHLTTSVIVNDWTDTTATASSILLIVDSDSLKNLSVAQISHTLKRINGKWLFTKRIIS
ncbi:nuclear transport factor 2 family protein [Lentilactobacillus sp. SPB1-3]|uniref:Nuclear transport factor 2 family protein n=1 Tax=Lentilactobacillus terminaliae TaxID=3003483 RepID=A0ACD5DE98_9LACO|nr:nuclear transport factor 2 family protein [Lentilactobacillus sp. SPB1-3]MCZ0977695.1 nuclear transport factor 2 family protein [Lentilactobacillus sp. SPB1-3]